MAAPGITIYIVTFHSPLIVNIVPLPVKYRNLSTIEVLAYPYDCYSYHICKCYKPHKTVIIFAFNSYMIDKEIERKKHEEKNGILYLPKNWPFSVFFVIPQESQFPSNVISFPSSFRKFLYHFLKFRLARDESLSFSLSKNVLIFNGQPPLYLLSHRIHLGWWLISN